MKSTCHYYLVMWVLCCTSLLYAEVELQHPSCTVVISEDGNAWYQDLLFYLHSCMYMSLYKTWHCCLHVWSAEVFCIYLTSRSALVGQGISYTTKIVKCLFIITVFYYYVFFFTTVLLLLPWCTVVIILCIDPSPKSRAEVDINLHFKSPSV